MLLPKIIRTKIKSKSQPTLYPNQITTVVLQKKVSATGITKTRPPRRAAMKTTAG